MKRNTRRAYFDKKDSIVDEDIEIRNGRVIEALPGALFRVEFEDKTNLICYIGGRMRVNKIKVYVGDRVAAQIDEYGGKGRVVKRL